MIDNCIIGYAPLPSLCCLSDLLMIIFAQTREHSKQGEYHCMVGLATVAFQHPNSNRFSCLVESNPVKLDTIFEVVLPTKGNVLCTH